MIAAIDVDSSTALRINDKFDQIISCDRLFR